MMTKKIEPEIFTYPGMDRGSAEVIKRLKGSKSLTDINLRLLEFVIRRWRKRNIKYKVDDVGFSKPATLLFPLSIGQKYKDNVILCSINEGTSLTSVEKLAVRLAFKFSSSDNSSSLNSRKSLEILTEHALLTIRQQDEEMFNVVFDELINLHALLIKLGEIADKKGKPINYAIIEASWWGTELHSEWARSYLSVFDASVNYLDVSSEFFDKCSHLAYRLSTSILENPSLTGLNSIINTQAILWFKLNAWWEKACEQQGMIHTITNPSTLVLPVAKTYKEATQTYIQGWENLHKYVLTNHIEKAENWESLAKLFDGFYEHLQNTLLFLGQSVITGNKHSTEYWADCLVRWYSNSKPLSGRDYYIINKSQEVVITPALLGMSWENALQILQSNLNGQEFDITPKDLFCKILKYFWQDACVIFSDFLILWALENGSNADNLAIDALERLLEGKVIDNANIHGKKIFIDNFDEYITSFIRRKTYHRWNKNTYAGIISGLASKIDSLTQREMIPGRIYSSYGSSIEKTYEADLILGAIKSQRISSFDASKFSKLFENEKIADNLGDEVESKLKLISTLDLTKYLPIFNLISPTDALQSTVNYQENNSGLGEVSDELPVTNAMVNRVSELEAALKALSELIKGARYERIKDLPISIDKLNKIAENASSKAFNKETAHFPVSLFKNSEWVTEPLSVFDLYHNDYPKGQLTEPVMDNTHYSKDWHHDAVSSRLYPYLILDIFHEAKKKRLKKKVIVNSEAKFAQKIIELSQQIRNQGLTPILIAENSRTPKWLSNWQDATWRRDVQLPAGINIERKEKPYTGGYLFHVNDVPVYDGRALTGGLMLFPIEMLKKVKFRQLDSGYPVKAIFTEDSNDPWHGKLTYHWERGVELDPSYKIYHLVYPSISESE